jgi:hypothetical protein
MHKYARSGPSESITTVRRSIVIGSVRMRIVAALAGAAMAGKAKAAKAVIMRMRCPFRSTTESAPDVEREMNGRFGGPRQCR